MNNKKKKRKNNSKYDLVNRPELPYFKLQRMEEDMVLFQNKLFAALKIPIEYISITLSEKDNDEQ